MTLLEIERLIRRIEDILEKPAANGALQKLAGEFHNIGRAASLRLNQCAEMLAAGDERQALQLAEAHPPLLDIITLLSFRRSPNWRALCRSENLPIHDPFDLKALHRLNETYAKDIDQDHALYRDYRRAIMLNDDAQAVQILRSIVRLNANDENARHELERFEKKQRIEKARRLETLVRSAKPEDHAEIAQLAAEVEGQHEPALWDKAQEIRASVLLAAAMDARKTGHLREVMLKLEELQRLTVFLSPAERLQLEELKKWSDQEQRTRAEAAGRRAALDNLAAVCMRLEQQDLAAKKRNITELRAALDAIERAWRQVEHFRAEVPADVERRAFRIRDSLRAEIENTHRASRRLAFVVVAVVVLLCLGAAWWAYSRQAAKSLAAHVETLIADRRVAETEKALQSGGTSPALLRARSHADEFLRRERVLKNAADQSLQRLEFSFQNSFTNVPPESIAAGFDAVRKAIAAEAPEFRAAASTQFQKVETAWNTHVEKERTARSSELSRILEPIEADAKSQLQFTRSPEDVLNSARALKARLAAVADLTNSSILRPKQESLFRLQQLEADLNRFSRDATNALAAPQTLAFATNWNAYNAGLQMILSSGFTPAPQRAAATALAGLNISSQTLLAPLLLPNGPTNALLQPPHLPRVPDEVLPAERDVQRRLRDDQNIHGLMRMEIEVKALPPEDPRRRRTVYLRGELQRRITRRSGQIYDPVENPNAINFVTKEMASLDFSIEEPTTTAEKDLYERVGLSRLLDSNTGKYQVSLLQVLDDTNLDRRANPLFRAYLHSRICEMIDAQPAQWSAIWSPNFARDRAELARLGAPQIHSGDWLVPANNARRAAALIAVFDRAALHSYSREAAFFKRLLPKAMELGVRPVGYATPDGEPQITDSSQLGAVWGLIAPGAPAQVVWQNGQRRAPAVPFSPLFVFAGNAGDLIDSILQSLSYSSSAVGIPETLPPILRPNP